MLGHVMKVVIVFVITMLASVFPAFAAVKKQMEEAGKYYDDISGLNDLEEFKEQRDVEAQRLRNEIFALRPVLKSDRSAMAKKVVERKVRILKEKSFLEAEFAQALEDLYQKGVASFSQKDYESSKLDFDEIEKLSPGFKETRLYLKKLAKLTTEKNSDQYASLHEEKE